MEVILLEKLNGYGNIGDVVSVKDGFARNYLIPEKKVVAATKENKALFESRKKDIEKESEAKRLEAEEIFSNLNEIFLVLIRQSGEDGRLYGSVSSRDIVMSISDKKKITLNRIQVKILTPIKYIGVHTSEVVLSADITAKVNLVVARSTDEAKNLEKEFLQIAKEKKEKKPSEEKDKKIEKDASVSEEVSKEKDNIE